MSLLRRLAVATPLGATVFAAAWVASGDSPQQRASCLYHVPVRLAHDVGTVASIVADYQWSLAFLEGSALSEAKSACHLRSAHKLVDLAFKNGAIYIKAGQHVGQLDHLLPPEYVLTMRAQLLDKCPLDTYEEVAAMVEADLGAPPEELFASFDPVPIASASLAQVHRAVSHDGQQLAVKVQHAGLRETAYADIVTIELLVGALHRLFPDFDYTWLVETTKENLPLELDFRIEAANAARCAANFRSARSRLTSRVAVPVVHRHLSSERVLTMDFMEGCGVTDLAALKAAGLSPSAVAQTISEIFAEMIFVFGDVHCDPHEANMLARKKDGHVEIVLLDHGLYRQITDDFRIQYAKLWKSLIMADVPGIKAAAVSMNAGDSYALFAGMLTQRPWDKVSEASADHLSLEHTEEGRQWANDQASHYAVEICDLLLRMPRALLLLLKTNDCLRSVDYALGQTINTAVITAKECTRALNDQRARERPGLRTTVLNAWDAGRIHWRMSLLAAFAWLAQLRGSLAARSGWLLTQ